jgi:hypothetical protein
MMDHKSKATDGLKALRARLDDSGAMTVQHENGYVWEASFEFYDPATADELQSLRNQGIALPEEFTAFLLYSNGALLFHDKEYGQWGFRLYATHELQEANHTFAARYPEAREKIPGILVVAESLGDGDVITVNHAGVVVDGDSGYSPQSWKPIAKNFGSWLNYVIVAQGAKYWRW